MLDDVTDVAMYTFLFPFAMIVELLTLMPTDDTMPVPPHESRALPCVKTDEATTETPLLDIPLCTPTNGYDAPIDAETVEAVMKVVVIVSAYTPP